MASSDPREPLLTPPAALPYESRHQRYRAQARAWLSSRAKHYVVMALVGADVAVVLADLFAALVACEAGGKVGEAARAGLEHAGLALSCLFMAELCVSVWAFGWTFFHDWFHRIDAAVIAASFLVDLLATGVFAELGELVIVFRLWRLVKIVDELGVSTAENNEDLASRLDAALRQNAALLLQLDALQNQP